MPYELHRSVLALCVTACIAYGTWPEEVVHTRRARPLADVEGPMPPIPMRPDNRPGEPPRYVARSSD
jgi:hypothetical protein